MWEYTLIRASKTELLNAAGREGWRVVPGSRTVNLNGDWCFLMERWCS